MNFDQRSKNLNTEVGLIIDSEPLAQQVALRFEAMVQPESAYEVKLRGGNPSALPLGRSLEWHTVEDGKPVVYTREPARSGWQRFKVRILERLPLDSEL
jgi:putative cardiolipin synthase